MLVLPESILPCSSPPSQCSKFWSTELCRNFKRGSFPKFNLEISEIKFGTDIPDLFCIMRILPEELCSYCQISGNTSTVKTFHFKKKYEFSLLIPNRVRFWGEQASKIWAPETGFMERGYSTAWRGHGFICYLHPANGASLFARPGFAMLWPGAGPQIGVWGPQHIFPSSLTKSFFYSQNILRFRVLQFISH